MFESHFFGLSDVGLKVWLLASVTLVLLLLALIAASASVFFRSASHFASDEREATMDLSPSARRRFYVLYASFEPRDPSIAWFLAVGLGPIGVNLYRGRPYEFVAALLSLNGLGMWWFESLFTAPQLVLIENRKHIAAALYVLANEDVAA